MAVGSAKYRLDIHGQTYSVVQGDGNTVIIMGPERDIVLSAPSPLVNALAELKHWKELIKEYDSEILRLSPQSGSQVVARGIFLALVLGAAAYCLLIGVALATSGSHGSDAAATFVVFLCFAVPIGAFIYIFSKGTKEKETKNQEVEVLQQKREHAQERVAKLESVIGELVYSEVRENKDNV
jgi:hypothetical protein